MQDHNLLTGHQWQPLTDYGWTHKFWTLNTDTITGSLIVTALLISFSLYARYVLSKHQSILKIIILKFVESFKELLHQTLQSAPAHHLAFIGSLFTFIFCCNVISLIPFVEEPTKDLNTTLALGLISFFYVQGNSIYHKGIKEYSHDFIQPFFLMFPLHVIGKLTSIMSLSFRLFGNIFGGYVISTLWFKLVSSSIYTQIAGLFLGLNLLLQAVFCIFDGTIQAFVFSMLTLTYLSMEIAPQEETEEL
jgi:F-type H+-transporting ATPase subunit a